MLPSGQTDKKLPMQTAKLLQKVHSTTQQAGTRTCPQPTVGSVSHRVLLSCTYFPLCSCVLFSVSPRFIKGWTEICIGVRLAHNCPANLCLPTPIFLPGEFHTQSSLVGYSPWGCQELDTAEWLTLSLSHKLAHSHWSREASSRQKASGLRQHSLCDSLLLSRRVRGPWASFRDQLGLVRRAERRSVCLWWEQPGPSRPALA